MEVLNTSLARRTAFVLSVVLFLPFCRAGAAPLPQSTSPAGGSGSQGQAQSSEGSAATGTEQSGSAQQAAPVSAPPAKPAQPPVGTAVAPYVKEGTSGSRPAGAAIAPLKQRRTRSLAIRAGLLVGAGIAIGVVAAATLGSPSRAH